VALTGAAPFAMTAAVWPGAAAAGWPSAQTPPASAGTGTGTAMLS
jgi:hypothetical protein